MASAIPINIAVIEAVTAVSPAPAATAKAPIPTAMADNPEPIRTNPPPIAAIPTPNKAIDPANPIIEGITGVNTAPAIPITVKAPAKTIRLLAISPIVISPSDFKTGVKIFNAADATNKAADPASVPVIAFKATANITNDPPKATKPFAISFHSILPIDCNACARINKELATIVKPTAFVIIPSGKAFIAMATAPKAPPNPNKPFPISPKSPIAVISLIADANIFIAAPIRINEAPVDITFVAFPVSFVNIANSANIAPIPAIPFTNSLGSPILAKSLTAEANIFIDAANITIPAAVLIASLDVLVVFKNKETAPIITDIPVRPTINSSKFNSASFFTADAITLIAAANITI